MRVAGYFNGVMGTGEHARQLVEALRFVGIAPVLTTLRPDASPEDDRLAPEPTGDDKAFAAFALLCANADMVPQVARQLGREFFSGRYTIGFWAWEVSSFPARFAPAFHHVNEVWVGSRHVRDAVHRMSPCPVEWVPQPVSLPLGAENSPAPGDLPEGFRFLFAFDYLSVFERKNPLAVIEAFTRAFPPGSGAKLLLKCLNGELAPELHQELRCRAHEHADIHLIERRLSGPERTGLLNAADCYVSLHRAEGFGYTLAESMWLGKPVIATGYSGNTDFMTPDNSYLVEHTLVPIGEGHQPYPPEAVWAQPDIDHAAALMLNVFENPEEARQRGARAAADIRRSHGLQSAGHAMRSRLELLQNSGLTHSPRSRALANIGHRLLRALRRPLAGSPIPSRRS